MSLAIGNFQALGTYDHATETITITSDINGWHDLTTAATAEAPSGDPEGIDFDIKVVYKNADYDTPALVDFEQGTWSYSLDGADETLVRQTTERSTTGGAINFNSDSNRVRVYGVVSAQKLNDLEARRAVAAIGASGNYALTTSNTFVDCGDPITITPSSVNHALYATLDSYFTLNSATSNYNKAELGLYYYNASDVLTLIEKRQFGTRSAPYGNMEDPTSISIVLNLDQSKLNSAGKWSIQLRMRSILVSTTTECIKSQALCLQVAP